MSAKNLIKLWAQKPIKLGMGSAASSGMQPFSHVRHSGASGCAYHLSKYTTDSNKLFKYIPENMKYILIKIKASASLSGALLVKN